MVLVLLAVLAQDGRVFLQTVRLLAALINADLIFFFFLFP